MFVGLDAQGGLLLVCSGSNARVCYAGNVLADVESRFPFVDIKQAVTQPVEYIPNQFGPY
jgi:hypothetical protein